MSMHNMVFTFIVLCGGHNTSCHTSILCCFINIFWSVGTVESKVVLISELGSVRDVADSIKLNLLF